MQDPIKETVKKIFDIVIKALDNLQESEVNDTFILKHGNFIVNDVADIVNIESTLGNISSEEFDLFEIIYEQLNSDTFFRNDTDSNNVRRLISGLRRAEYKRSYNIFLKDI
ncbi:gp58 [Sphingomonas phage PAU]|uniref:gp58 n=1 Tax=Sphingomonas phage PAU TaxID=1150991 RepID=UPI00025731C4|nr:gp58 [Sphingomonas phage PAU]AFF28056.1 gp58 [Sphingomonas phage PAU]